MAEKIDAWRIPADDGEDGILVNQSGCWWLICPQGATWYPPSEQAFDDCSQPSCDYLNDVHRRAAGVVRSLREDQP